MAAMTSKFNFECVIQYYTDQRGERADVLTACFRDIKE